MTERGRSEHGHGDEWSPLNGNSPWWANMFVWILRQGLIFQLIISGLLIAVVLVIFGWKESPMLTAFQDLAKSSASQVIILREINDAHKEQEALLERIERMLDR